MTGFIYLQLGNGMLKNTITNLLVTLLLISGTTHASDKEISITIDDLPFVGSSKVHGDSQHGNDRFNLILQALIDEQVPATGFVIAGSIAKWQWQLLENFKKQGFVIGNHTYTHPSLNEIGAEKYINEIAKADKRLTPLMPDKKYFRYPYLAEGRGENRHQVKAYLAENQYIVAPVTIDSKDFVFNKQLISFGWKNRSSHLKQIKERYLNYILKQTEIAEKMANGRPVKEILLVHSNLLNSYMIGDVIQFYKEHGYRFISLDEALTTRPASTQIQAKQSKFTVLINKFARRKSIQDNPML